MSICLGSLIVLAMIGFVIMALAVSPWGERLGIVEDEPNEVRP